MLFKNMKNTFIITGLQFNNIFKKKKNFLELSHQTFCIGTRNFSCR